MGDYYVYVYFDPRKTPAEPIYVGKGRGNRCWDHIRKGATNVHLANKLNKIKEANLEPVVELVEVGLTCEEALSAEVSLIAKYGRADRGLGPLTNWTDGGEGTEGYKHRESTRKLFSEQRKGKKQTAKQYEANCNRVVSDAARQKISKANKGQRRHTQDQIQSIKTHNQSRSITDETRKKWSETRLNNTPTKAKYPPDEVLIQMIDNSSRNQVAKMLGIGFASLSKYLKRRGLIVRDARFRQRDIAAGLLT